MAMVAGTAARAWGGQALRYAGTAIVQSIVQAVQKEIGENLTLANVNRALQRIAPGKKHKAARKAAKVQLLGGGGGMISGMTSAPVSRSYAIRKTKPVFRSQAGKYVVSNREYCGDILGNATFGIEGHLIQPGIGALFPWLSQIANTHERYRFTRLSFEYVPVVATSVSGRLTMALAIDPLDDTPNSKAELFQYSTSREASVWAGCNLVVDLSSRPGSLFTRGGAVENTDIKTYDFGKLFVGVSNSSVTTIIGELFVSYEVEFETPKPSYCPASRTILTSATTLGNTNWFGLDVATGTGGGTSYSPPGGTWTWTATGPENRVTFTATGTYLLAMSITGTGVAATNRSGTAGVTTLFSSLNAGATNLAAVFFITVNVSGQFMDIHSNNTTTTGLDIDLTVFTDKATTITR